jgi:hypothetical protein
MSIERGRQVARRLCGIPATEFCSEQRLKAEFSLFLNNERIAREAGEISDADDEAISLWMQTHWVRK